MLKSSPAVAVVAVADLDRGKEFYGQTLGLGEPDISYPHGVLYGCGAETQLLVYQTSFAGSNEATAAVWEVADLDAVVSGLRSQGITFEQYDLPGVERDGDIHTVAGLRAVWFKDPDGNILNLVANA